MIKLQDFARECGVTDRAIQKHLKNHEAKLEGHFERRGKNGTWLDETAQSYIKSLMIQQPIVIGDSNQLQKIYELRDENDSLKDNLLEARKQIIELTNKTNKLELEKKDLQHKLDSRNDDDIKELQDKLHLADQRVNQLQAQLNEFRPTLFGFYKRK